MVPKITSLYPTDQNHLHSEGGDGNATARLSSNIGATSIGQSIGTRVSVSSYLQTDAPIKRR